MPPTVTVLRVTPMDGATGAVAARAVAPGPALKPRPTTTTAAADAAHHRDRRDNGYFTGTTAPHVYGTFTEYAVPLLVTSAPHGVGFE